MDIANHVIEEGHEMRNMDKIVTILHKEETKYEKSINWKKQKIKKQPNH